MEPESGEQPRGPLAGAEVDVEGAVRRRPQVAVERQLTGRLPAGGVWGRVVHAIRVR